MTSRRQFFALLLSTLIVAPLVRLGWMKAPLPRMLLSPRMQTLAVESLKGLFSNSAEIRRQYRKGAMLDSSGFEWLVRAWPAGGFARELAGNSAKIKVGDTIHCIWPPKAA